MKSALLLSLLAAPMAHVSSAHGDGAAQRVAANDNNAPGLRGGSGSRGRRGLGGHKGPRPETVTIEAGGMSMAPVIQEMSSEEKHEAEKMKKMAHGHKHEQKSEKVEKSSGRRRHGNYEDEGAEAEILAGVDYVVDDSGNKKEHTKKEHTPKYKPGKEEKTDKAEKTEKATKYEKSKPEKSAKVNKAEGATVSDWPPTPSPVDASFVEEIATTTPASSVSAVDTLEVQPEPEESMVLPTSAAAAATTTEASMEGPVATLAIDDAPGITTEAPEETEIAEATDTTTIAAIITTVASSADETDAPTPAPTWVDEEEETDSPTDAPTWAPEEEETDEPTPAPTWLDEEEETDEPTASPTWSPTILESCPNPFDPTKTTYVLGETVEVRENIFLCENVLYCNVPEWDETLLEEDPNAKELWNSAWVYDGPCDPTSMEEVLEDESS